MTWHYITHTYIIYMYYIIVYIYIIIITLNRENCIFSASNSWIASCQLFPPAALIPGRGWWFGRWCPRSLMLDISSTIQLFTYPWPVGSFTFCTSLGFNFQLWFFFPSQFLMANPSPHTVSIFFSWKRSWISSGRWFYITIFKHISQWEGLSHILWEIKHVWSHQPVIHF